MTGISKIPCPCCGKTEVEDFDICEECGWQNDHTETPGRERTGANRMSIEEAKEAYRNGQPVQ